jgi:hypothetical protein
LIFFYQYTVYVVLKELLKSQHYIL